MSGAYKSSWLEENGRKVSKRYAASDLRAVQESSMAG